MMADRGPATRSEVMAATIAHDLEDGWFLEAGANSPVARAGALLAHLTHGPNMTVMLALTRTHLRDLPTMPDFEYVTDARAMRWAESYLPHDKILNDMKFRRRGVFFCGGLQIDQFGNSNLIGIGPDPRKLKVRGPGGIGTCNATAHSGRYYLIAASHSPRVLVERVDYISAFGYGDGSPGARERIGLRNPGPRFIITPLCVFDFDPATNRARLKSLHPGVTKAEVVEQTGFTFASTDPVEVTPGPSEQELELLRDRIDIQGHLR